MRSPHASVFAVCATLACIAPVVRAQCPLLQLVPSPAPGPNDYLGYAVAIGGDHIAVGNPLEDAPAWGGAGLDAGAVFLAHRTGGVWGPAQRVFPQGSAPQANGEGFGSCVAIDGNWAVIGAPAFDTATVVNCGAAYVFEFDVNTASWLYRQRLLAFNAAMIDDPQAYETFGRAVGVRGNAMIVGGPQAGGGGRACIFRLIGGTWVKEQSLTHPAPTGADRFGAAVGMSGIRLVVGAPNHDSGAVTDSGSAVVYADNGGNWTPLAPPLELAAPIAYAHFGAAVAITGDTALVGAPGDITNPGGMTSGSATVYEWGVTFTGIPLPPTVPVSGQKYGTSVAIEGRRAIVGASGESESGLAGAGAAYVFERSLAGTWGAGIRLVEPAPLAQHAFGCGVAVSGADVAIGAYGLFSSGAAYVSDGACTTPPIQIPLAFDPALASAVGGDPLRIVADDFDADGNVDIAMITTGVPSVRIAWGNAAGGFAAQTWSDALPAVPTSLAVGDLDDDGLPDLAVASAAAKSIRFYRNGGGRNLTYRATYNHPYHPVDIAVGELTGDCRLDLVTGDGTDHRYTVIRNDGVWNFSVHLSTVTGSGVSGVAAADIDGDGDDDVAVCAAIGRGVYFYENVGQPYMTGMAVSPQLFASGSLGGFALADFDGDGDLDAFVTNESTGQVTTVHYTGAPQLQVGAITTVGGVPGKVVAGDIDGDNDTDVVLSDPSPTPRFLVLQNHGGGTFNPPVAFAGIGPDPDGIGLADLDFDGRLDMVASSAVNNLYVRRNDTAHDCDRDGTPDHLQPVARQQIGLIGASTGGTCAWEASSPGIVVGAFDSGCAPVGSPPDEIAARLVARINAAGIPAMRARRVAGQATQIEIAAPGAWVDFCTGPAGGPPTCCLLSSTVCSCNPDLILLSGEDCNANGEDDAIDIYFDAAADADRNGVLDLCEQLQPIAGDLDGDGDVDRQDLTVLIACLRGPIADLDADCTAADLDGDRDVDLAEFAAFQVLFAAGGNDAQP